MKKKSEAKNDAPRPSMGNGYVVSTHTPDSITGRVLTIVEASGLSEKQEESVKNLIRQAIWSCFEDAIFISEQRHWDLRELYWQKKREAAANGLPVSEI